MYKNREEIRRIMIAVSVMDGIYDIIAKKIGITENKLVLLYALDDGELHSQKEISEQWLIPKTTLNTIIKECVEEGYVFLNASSGKKEKEICLTKKGKEYEKNILYKVYEIEGQAMVDTLEKFSPEFIDVLEEFVANLKKETGKYFDDTGKTI